LAASNVALNNIPPTVREFYTGRPLWKQQDGSYHPSPWGHRRLVNSENGAFYWTKPNSDEPLLTGQGSWVYDTLPFWERGPDPEPQTMEVDSSQHESASGAGSASTDDGADLYSAN